MSAPASGPFLALPRGASARHRRGSLERAYDAFLLDGSVHPDLRPVVAESWRLCRAHGVSPDGVLPVVDLLDAELEGYRNQHPLATVMPLIWSHPSDSSPTNLRRPMPSSSATRYIRAAATAATRNANATTTTSASATVLPLP